jgi:predicted GNAT family acetyltransferase
MRVRRAADAAAFLQAARSFLEDREAERNLPFSIARQCADDPAGYEGPNYFATVGGGAAVDGIALMTAPHRVQAFMPADAAAVVADDLTATRWPVPGVFGPEAAAHAFAQAWAERHRAQFAAHRRLRSFELTGVTPVSGVPGAMRQAADSDLATVAAWYRAFIDETEFPISANAASEMGRRALRQGRVHLWEHTEPVAQAVVVGATPRGVRIGMVYTPPDRRGRGYAKALTGALSQQCLDRGAAFCVLFTDLSNPVSNAIYPKVGYRPIADFEEIDFRPGR